MPWNDEGDGPLAANQTTPFTGRRRELAELQSLQDAAAQRKGALVLTAGEAAWARHV